MPTDTDVIVDTTLIVHLDGVEIVLDQLRQAVRDGAFILAVDLIEGLAGRVHALAAAFPEEHA